MPKIPDWAASLASPRAARDALISLLYGVLLGTGFTVVFLLLGSTARTAVSIGCASALCGSIGALAGRWVPSEWGRVFGPVTAAVVPVIALGATWYSPASTSAAEVPAAKPDTLPLVYYAPPGVQPDTSAADPLPEPDTSKKSDAATGPGATSVGERRQTPTPRPRPRRPAQRAAPDARQLSAQAQEAMDRAEELAYNRDYPGAYRALDAAERALTPYRENPVVAQSLSDLDRRRGVLNSACNDDPRYEGSCGG
jgi:hypothetical protein